MFLDSEEPIFYIKAVDIQGNVQSFDTFDYTKREPPAPPSYATTEDLGALAKQLSAMQKMLEDLTSPTK